MAAEAEYIKKTQDTLGSVVKKPPLTDKLLAKPPFRFLHDVLMAVIKNTGFMEGLYNGDELDSVKVNDKDKKVAFLQKAIDLVQLINGGEPLSVKPGKIVAGQEPDKTNEFLQALAAALKKQPNSAEYVKRVLSGDLGGEANSSAGSNKENKKTRSASKEKKEEKKEEKDGKHGSKSRSASKEGRESSAKTSSSKREQSSERMSSKSSSKEKSDDQLKTKSSSKERKEIETPAVGDDRKSSDKKSASSKDKDKKSSSSSNKDEKKSKKAATDEPDNKNSKKQPADESDDKKDNTTKKHKSKKKDDDADQTTNPINNHLSTMSMNGEEETSSTKVKKGKLKIDLSKKEAEPNELNGDNEIDDRPVSPPVIPTGGARRSSVSAKQATRPTLSAVDGSRGNNDHDFQGDDDEGLVKPGVVRQTRSARPATASSTTARPGTAAGRPATVKQEVAGLKRREITLDDKKLARNDSIVYDNQPVAGKVITETTGTNGVVNNHDDDDNFIIDDRDGQLTMDGLLNDKSDDIADDVDERDDHGQLVRKILETKKGLENQIKSESGGKSGDKAMLIVYDVKEKEKTKQECQKLHELVQQLTRNSHPLGKIVDFLQEDVDSMLKELQQWRQEYKTNMTNVRQQMDSDGGQLEPLKSKLNEIDQQINDQMDAIVAVRGRMLANEDKIQKLLASVAKK